MSHPDVIQQWAPVALEIILAFSALSLALRPVVSALLPKSTQGKGWARLVQVLAVLEYVAQILGTGVPPKKPPKPKGDA